MKVRQNRQAERQMSEAFITSVFLALSGGFQDAYTYFTRDEVFSNAQTGNVVLMSQHFMMGEWQAGLRYLYPLFAFAFGVFFAEQVQGRFKYAKKLHWRQSILLMEILILFFVGFLTEGWNMLATVLVSFPVQCRFRHSGKSTDILMRVRCVSEISEVVQQPYLYI